MNSSLARIRAMLERGDCDSGLTDLYGREALDFQKKRYLRLVGEAEKAMSDRPAVVISAPGRTELGGNHTDHNNGRVLAAAVDLDCLAAVSASGTEITHLVSNNYSNDISLNFEKLEPIPDEKESPQALVRGVAAARRNRGLETGGFTGFLHSTCKPGTGLSSSAAFSVLAGAACALLAGEAKLDPLQLAHDARYAENHFFGKPCGLMDQISSALGGTLSIDFERPDFPNISRIETDFTSFRYRLIVVDTGTSHIELTSDYAAIPEEIGKAVAVFQREKARGITIDDFIERLPAIRERAGDRAALRLLHFICEDHRAGLQAEALRDRKFDDFLDLVRQSGESSCKHLQNCSAPGNVREQGVLLALALTGQFFPKAVCRVHGGGFAGTVQTYVPDAMFTAYQKFMANIFGPEAVMPIRVGRPGVCFLNETGWHFPELSGA